MSQQGRKPEPNLTCRQCGATNDLGASECWLCQSANWRGSPGTRPRYDDPRSPRGSLGSIIAWMILTALAVFCGISLKAPGLAVALMICAVPAWALTEFKAARRRRQDEPMSGVERALWIVALTILIPIVVLIALIVALFTFCMFAR